VVLSQGGFSWLSCRRWMEAALFVSYLLFS
jgi:hypothetical protein